LGALWGLRNRIIPSVSGGGFFIPGVKGRRWSRVKEWKRAETLGKEKAC